MGGTERVTWRHTHDHLWDREPAEVCSMPRGARLGLGESLEGWNELGGVRDVQEAGDMCIPMADFTLMCGRDQHNIVKQLFFNKNK